MKAETQIQTEFKNLDINKAYEKMQDDTALNRVIKNNFDNTFNEVTHYEKEKVNKLMFYAIDNSMKQTAKYKRYNYIVIFDCEVIYKRSNVIDATAPQSTLKELKKLFKRHVNFLNDQIK